MCWSLSGHISAQICQGHRPLVWPFSSLFSTQPAYLYLPKLLSSSSISPLGFRAAVCRLHSVLLLYLSCLPHRDMPSLHFSCWSFENTNALSVLERKTFHGLYTAHHGLFHSVMAPHVQLPWAPAPWLVGVVGLVMLTVALELPPIPIRTNIQLGNRQFMYPPGKIWWFYFWQFRSTVRCNCTVELRVRFQSSVIKVVNNKLEFHSSLFS